MYNLASCKYLHIQETFQYAYSLLFVFSTFIILFHENQWTQKFTSAANILEKMLGCVANIIIRYYVKYVIPIIDRTQIYVALVMEKSVPFCSAQHNILVLFKIVRLFQFSVHSHNSQDVMDCLCEVCMLYVNRPLHYWLRYNQAQNENVCICINV